MKPVEVLRWTKDRPTKVGFYWTRTPWSKRSVVVEVVQIEDEGWVYLAGTDEGHEIGEFDVWYGPIEAPEGAP